MSATHHDRIEAVEARIQVRSSLAARLEAALAAERNAYVACEAEAVRLDEAAAAYRAEPRNEDKRQGMRAAAEQLVQAEGQLAAVRLAAGQAAEALAKANRGIAEAVRLVPDADRWDDAGSPRLIRSFTIEDARRTVDGDIRLDCLRAHIDEVEAQRASEQSVKLDGIPLATCAPGLRSLYPRIALAEQGVVLEGSIWHADNADLFPLELFALERRFKELADLRRRIAREARPDVAARARNGLEYFRRIERAVLEAAVRTQGDFDQWCRREDAERANATPTPASPGAPKPPAKVPALALPDDAIDPYEAGEPPGDAADDSDGQDADESRVRRLPTVDLPQWLRRKMVRR
jgi:hypothetical protein